MRAVIVQNLDMARRERGSLGVRGRIWEQVRSALLPDADQLARQRMMYSHDVMLLSAGCAQCPESSVRHRTPARRALLREADCDRWLDASVDDAPGFFTTFGSGDLQADRLGGQVGAGSTH